MTFAISLIISYLIGSIPNSLWIGKLFFNKDVREEGSGSAGATNTFRVLGWKIGLLVFILDGLKGFIAIHLINYINISPEEIPVFNIGIVIMTVLGHIFPVYAGFRGGKGVATMLGIMIALHPWAALIGFLTFIIVFIAFKIVSLGSLSGGVAFTLTCYLMASTPGWMQYFATAVTILLFFTHRKNIGRLIRNEENKISISSKHRKE